MSNVEKFLAYEGMAKITCVDTTEVVRKAKEIHNLSKTATAALGRLLTMGVIIGADLKEDTDNVTLQVKGNGPIGSMTVVTKKGAKVKGCVTNPEIEVKPKENGKLDVQGIVGNEGYIYIIKDIGLKEPYVGISEIVSGEIAEDFANYYATSEQIPTVLALGVCFDDNNEVKKAGGYLLQLMPDATEEIIDKLEKIISNVPSITQMLSDNISLYDIAKTITGDEYLLTMLGEISNEYICDCSEDRMTKGLISLGKDELKDIISEGKDIDLECHFCNKKYTFDVNKLNELLQSID
ncbi:MAG: Hsp33 family molecular chaperone HslO [Clostridiales bacterium]|nr:Hsp33 family molecular chaperone HslO [Clostridiales bacterium]